MGIYQENHRKPIGKPRENGGFMGFFMGFSLWCYIDPPCLMGKLTHFLWIIFDSNVINYQKVIHLYWGLQDPVGRWRTNQGFQKGVHSSRLTADIVQFFGNSNEHIHG